MSLALSGHGHCIQCQRYETDRRKTSVRRCAKHARSKLDRRDARDEITEGEWAREDEQRELAARLYALRLDALDEGCDGPTCSCHARRAAAVEELNALRRTETP